MNGIAGEASSRRDSESDTDSDSNASADSAIWDSYHPIREGVVQGNIPTRMFREYPVDEEILPLLTAMARSVARMPVLQSLSVEADLNGCRDAVFDIMFTAPGRKDFMDVEDEDRERPRLYWRTGDWRPCKQVLALWEEAVPGLLVRFFDV